MKFKNNNFSSDYSQYSHNYDPIFLEKLLFKLSKQWIAGHNIDEAIDYAKLANKKGFLCIINYLGENITESSIIKKTVDEYQNLIKIMNYENIGGCISIKPSQIGLTLGHKTCLNNLIKILEVAKQNDKFVWLDMEAFRFVEPTLSIYKQIIKKQIYQIGIVLQSYLRRSLFDLSELISLEPNCNIRLVKGAYRESVENAFITGSEINKNYLQMSKLLFSSYQQNRHKDSRAMAIATHDPTLVNEILRLYKIYSLKKDTIQFQFLKGIQEKLKLKLSKKGFNVYEYIPYGEKWLSYSLRRLKERRRNILLLVRSLLPY